MISKNVEWDQPPMTNVGFHLTCRGVRYPTTNL